MNNQFYFHRSTCIQLIQKFYNPLSVSENNLFFDEQLNDFNLNLFLCLFFSLKQGSVSIDGINVNDWNTQQLRKFIGVVSQEPVLFATTIRENIRYGNPDASNEEIEKAARIANCHNFIMKLSEGYETSIGERGAQL
jgi:ABC-type multidrug transport system fused ATPase/permease subunit